MVSDLYVWFYVNVGNQYHWAVLWIVSKNCKLTNQLIKDSTKFLQFRKNAKTTYRDIKMWAKVT